MTPFKRRERESREGGDICAIFVHAGAGYHSFTNEKHHLAACSDAARVAMTILRNGGDAIDAVEIAIKLLEDREITNSGFGSNLTIVGQVECDATMVDHFGRSGAVGAVSQIKNPIGLARLVLNESTKQLSLQRVPPNLLVGPGATDYAYNNGLPVTPHDFLVSEGARERWNRWRQDLQGADERRTSITPVDPATYWDQPSKQEPVQPYSPPTSPDQPLPISSGLARASTPTRPLIASTADLPAAYLRPKDRESEKTSPQVTPRSSKRSDWDEDADTAIDDQMSWQNAKRPRIDGSADDADSHHGDVKASFSYPTKMPQRLSRVDEDHITDTVGAIAVDCFGHIAAGSSSGGIGMKHRGRCGPAALVGIGTAVVPLREDDPSRTSVATVTSGTGEHMATTMAASTAAERIYSSIRKKSSARPDENPFEECDEDQAMAATIKEDFMNHPGVRNSHCAGAIGIMTVKKTRDGIFLYFGHNTDSFALASMHSDERKPTCTMSRSQTSGSIAQGGRALKYRKNSMKLRN